MKWLTVLTALAVTALVPAAHRPDPLQRDADAIRDLGVVGVAVQVSTGHGGRSVTSGRGDLRTGRPMPADGYERIASVRKAFTATVMLQLVAEGRVRLDDPVSRWLPDLAGGSRMTVRHLLQNTSGVPDDLPGYTTEAEYYEQRFDLHTRAELIARGLAHAPAFEPGTAWAYSNTGFLLADLVIERVTGRTLRQEYTDRIVRPLGLRGTVFPATATAPGLPAPHSRAYQQFGPGTPVDVTVQVSGDPDAVLSVPSDLAAFFRALLGGRLLPPAELAEMRRTVPVSGDVAAYWPGGRYGLGLVSRPLPCGGVRWGHDGGDAGYITVTGSTADGRHAVVVSMNTALADTPEHIMAEQRAADTLVEHELCR